MTTRAFIALGSNVGDRLANLRRAVGVLNKDSMIAGISSVYESKAVGPPQPDYLNAAVAVETELSPLELLKALKGIERQLGRRPRQRWGPREIDLDLLLYGDAVIDLPGLKVPHPRLHERAFVLIPLNEVRDGPAIPIPPGAETIKKTAGPEDLGSEQRAGAGDPPS